MGTVDFHSHFFSRTFFETLAGQSKLPGDVDSRLATVSKRTGIELPEAGLDAHLARWTADLDAKGVDHLVSFASVPEEAPVLAEASRASKGRLIPMALVNLAAPGADKAIEARMAEGFAGVLVFPAMHHYHLGDEACRPALEALNAAGGVCYVHCGILVVKLRDLLGLPRPYDLAYANPLGIVPAAGAFPDVRFVVPHFGAGFLRETLMLGAQCENVYVDTSSSNGWLKTQPTPMTLQDAYARALGVYGPQRILFGTDSGIFPAGWRADRRAEQLEVMRALGLSEPDQDAILGGNARRLLKL